MISATAIPLLRPEPSAFLIMAVNAWLLADAHAPAEDKLRSIVERTAELEDIELALMLEAASATLRAEGLL